MTTRQKKDKTFSVGTIKKTNLIPTKNLLVFGDDRKVTSMWLSQSVHGAFIDACKLTGRKTCDVIEPFERAYVECVKKVILKDKIEPCPLKPIIFNLTLNITEKYAKRGRKENKGLVFCKVSGKYGSKDYCKRICKFGRNYEKYKTEPCRTYLAFE